MEFFQETRHALGRTALMLSGGGLLGMYHNGIIKTLYELGIMPKIIAGSSAGSLVAALFATKKEEELEAHFNP